MPARPLRYDRGCEIVSVAAGVAGLKVVAVDRHNAAIGQVTERTLDGIGARVADQSHYQP